MRKLTAAMPLIVMTVLTACSPGSGTNITPAPEQRLNPLEEPELVLAEETELALEEITHRDTVQVEWPDACLGAAKPEEVCAQVVTPGFRIRLDTPEGIYQINTDQSGETYRILPPSEVQELKIAILWERSGGIAGICQELTIQYGGSFELVDCLNDHILNKGNLSNQEWKQLSDWLNAYAPFEYRTQPPEGSADLFIDNYVFNGRGDQTASLETQLEINEFLAMLAADLIKPPDNLNLDIDSGIQGQALRGPVCPGPQPAEGPGATQCADQPTQATLIILDQQENEVAKFQTGQDGGFKVGLAPGTYELVPVTDPEALFPMTATQIVTVREGEFTEVMVNFDTGIR